MIVRTKLAGTALLAALVLAPAAAAEDVPTEPPIADTPPSTLSVGKPVLRGTTLSLPISCIKSGSVKVSFKGGHLGTSRFRCAQLRATVRLGVPRRLAGTRDAQLTVTARSGSSVVTRRVSLSGGAVARPSALAGPWYLHAQCDGYNALLGRPAISATGALWTNLAGGDTYYIGLRLADMTSNRWISDWVIDQTPFRAGLHGTSYLPVGTQNWFYMPHGRTLAVYGAIYSSYHRQWLYEGYLPASGINFAQSRGVFCWV